jgi:tetratricopeptide (TPR) repeat protein
MNLRLSHILMLGLLLVTASDLLAGPSQAPRRMPEKVKHPSQFSETEQRIMAARQQMSRRDYFTAAQLLEVAYESEPKNSVVHNLLRQCYQELKLYTKAEILIKRLIGDYPRFYGYRVDLAEVLIRQGREDEALEAYDQALSLVKANRPSDISLIVKSLIRQNLHDKALKVIDRHRLISGDSLLFAMERGEILENRREYRLAADEYYHLLIADTTTLANSAEKRLSGLLEFVESSGEVESYLLEQVSLHTAPRPLQVLTSYYIKSGSFDKAFEYSLRRDSLSKANGGSLLYFMRECQGRKQYDQVVRMGQYIYGRYDRAPIALESSFRYAEALTYLGEYARAIEVYEHIGDITETVQDKAEALYEIGYIYFDRLMNYPMALTYFDSVMTHFRSGNGAMQARIRIPHCHLRSGDLETAKEQFAKLAAGRLANTDIREEVDYYLALVDFYGKQYDSSEVRLRKLMVDYPRGYYINDALRLVLLLGEAADTKELLGEYSGALWFLERKMPDSGRVRFESLVSSEDRRLTDVALLALMKLDLNEGDSTAALATVDRLISDFPESYFMPFGMKTKADILAGEEESLDESRRLYRLLLENYTNYPFTSEVRKKLRAIEIDRKIG